MLIGSNINVIPRIVAYHTQVSPSCSATTSGVALRTQLFCGFAFHPCRPSAVPAHRTSHFSCFPGHGPAVTEWPSWLFVYASHHRTATSRPCSLSTACSKRQGPPDAWLPIVDDLGPCAKTIPGIHSIITGCEVRYPSSLGRLRTSPARSLGEFMLKMRAHQGGHALFEPTRMRSSIGS